jgi:hypothetical protein
MNYSVYIQKEEKKWDVLYALNMDKIIELKKLIDKLYKDSKYNSFKNFSRTDSKYDRELESISKLTMISIDKIYFYNNVIGYIIDGTSFIIENNYKLIQVTQFISTYKNDLIDLIINVKFHKNKDSDVLFSATTILGYIGVFSAKNNRLSISINFEKYNITDFIYYNTDPGLCLREMFENELNYTQCKDIIKIIVLKYPCYFVLTTKENKYKIMYKEYSNVKILGNIYHIGTNVSFLVKSCKDKQLVIEKKILELLQYPLYDYDRLQTLLFGTAIKKFVNDNLQKILNEYPFIDNTLYFYICSITDEFNDIYCPK